MYLSSLLKRELWTLSSVGREQQAHNLKVIGSSPIVSITINKKGCVIVSQYVITDADGDRFIYRNQSGKYVPVKSEMMADIYSKKQAEQIYNYSLPKALKSVFHVEKYDKELESVKQVSQEDLDKNTEKVMMAENIKVWLDKLCDMNGLIKEAKKRKIVLEKELKIIEDERLDIEHWIEFSKFNGVQGYIVSKELKECRMKRRTIKNELLVLDIILEQKVNGNMIEEVKKRILGMDSRTYKPRIRTDLFDL